MSRLYFVDAMPYCFAQSIDDVLTWWAVYSAFPFRVNPKLELGTGTTPHVLIFLKVICFFLEKGIVMKFASISFLMVGISLSKIDKAGENVCSNNSLPT